MPTSIVTFQTRQHERYSNLVREVAHHLTDEQTTELLHLDELVKAGVLDVREAHACLVALRAQQRGLAA